MSQVEKSAVVSFKVRPEIADELEDDAWENRVRISALMRGLVQEYRDDEDLQERAISNATE